MQATGQRRWPAIGLAAPLLASAHWPCSEPLCDACRAFHVCAPLSVLSLLEHAHTRAHTH